MKRRVFLGIASAAVMTAGIARAEGVADAILAQLRKQGYRVVSVERTLLGRTRIVAISATYRREIILNPRTGEILRDFWKTIETQRGSAEDPGLIDPEDSGRGGSDGPEPDDGPDDGPDDASEEESDDSSDDESDDASDDGGSSDDGEDDHSEKD